MTFVGCEGVLRFGIGFCFGVGLDVGCLFVDFEGGGFWVVVGLSWFRDFCVLVSSLIEVLVISWRVFWSLV